MEERLQKILKVLRCSLGWSASELGKRTGVTRQTINNMESGNEKFHLSKTLYLAIRYVIEKETRKNPEGTGLANGLLTILVDYPEKFDEDFRNKAYDIAKMYVPSIVLGDASPKMVYDAWFSAIYTI